VLYGFKMTLGQRFLKRQKKKELEFLLLKHLQKVPGERMKKETGTNAGMLL